ncbi:MAG: molybdate ABC transporter substrate-binding protein [Micropruina sp.]|uniref:molybdate ABC transporter substrate-binding protein n=1 Tax=Micropruina sp. TaxID=2737536 RepID=UPI0039E2ED4E
MRRLVGLCLALVLGLAVSGCGSAPASSEKTVQVFAAASLTKVFTDLGAAFEKSHPGTKVVFTFDGSSGLVDQLKGGAKADVFASADEKNMNNAVAAKLTSGEQTIFARNELTLVVPPSNPGKITGLNDSLKGKKLVVCAPEVPCGSATNTLAQKLDVTLKPVSQESKVTDVLGKVTSGEADAGIVYVTDAKGAGDKVETIAIEGSEQVVNNYPISVLASAPQPALAAEFVTLVTAQTGKDALSAAGFVTP